MICEAVKDALCMRGRHKGDFGKPEVRDSIPLESSKWEKKVLKSRFISGKPHRLISAPESKEEVKIDPCLLKSEGRP